MAVTKKFINEVVCDVCGEKADGDWSSVEYLNGEISGEYSCPIDLCKTHMKLFDLYYTNYKQERYDKATETIKEMLIRSIKYVDRVTN